MNEWISTSDRLPRRGVTVTIRGDLGESTGEIGPFGMWFVDDDSPYCGSRRYQITHWRPMPFLKRFSRWITDRLTR